MKSCFAPMLLHIQKKLVDEKHAAEAAKRYLEWQKGGGKGAAGIERGLQVDKEPEEACTAWRALA